MKRTALSAILVLCGCTNVFLQPDRELHDRPEHLKAAYRVVRFSAADGTKLVGTWFPAQGGAIRGVVVQFHGNAQNMTSHYRYVYWLALEGYEVFVFDYRGYGASEGKKSIYGSVLDGVAALEVARSRARELQKGIIVIGQSLGGALAVAALDRDGGADVRALILDSTFASYRDVAKQKLGEWPLTWALQWPLSRLLVSDRYSPVSVIARRKPAALLMLHAKGDPVVPFEMGRDLFDHALGPKEWWTLESGGHAEAFDRLGPLYRPRLLRWLDRILSES